MLARVHTHAIVGTGRLALARGGDRPTTHTLIYTHYNGTYQVIKWDATLRGMSEDLLDKVIENYESMSPQQRYNILANVAVETCNRLEGPGKSQ